MMTSTSPLVGEKFGVFTCSLSRDSGAEPGALVEVTGPKGSKVSGVLVRFIWRIHHGQDVWSYLPDDVDLELTDYNEMTLPNVYLQDRLSSESRSGSGLNSIEIDASFFNGA